jgi:hypothetical protein
MFLNAPGMRFDTPSIGRVPEIADRRGMGRSTPGRNHMSVSADRRGMHRDASSTFPDATFFACPPNGLAFSCRERAGKGSQKPTIARAQRSAAMPGWAGALGRVRLSNR